MSDFNLLPNIPMSEIWEDMNTLDDAAFEAKYYTSMIAEPRYPVPAIPLVAVWQDEEWYAGVIRLEQVTDTETITVAIYDENWDRCMDWNVPHCQFFSPDMIYY